MRGRNGTRGGTGRRRGVEICQLGWKRPLLRALTRRLCGVTDQTITYAYDAGTNQKGQLTSAGDANHSLAWSYDTQGRISGKGQTVGGVTLAMGYGYNAAGQLASTVLPSGSTIAFGYNTNGQVTSLTLNGTTTILSGITYDPFGPITGWTWGNGTSASRGFDTDGKITQVDNAGGASLKNYAYDDAFRITGISDAGDSSLSWTYGYDSLDRLSSASRTGITQGWTYDKNGNRLTQTGTTPGTYTNSSTSNRLSSTTGSLARTYAYDNAGNTLSYAGATFTYNNRGRMSTASNAGTTAAYTYNALGQRIRRTTSSATTLYAYDETGHLVGEYTAAGGLIQETVWLGDTPVATLRPNGSGGVTFYYVHADHLNTPRLVTDASNNIRWRWDSDPFGTTLPNQNPAGLGAFDYSLRFPGQQFDAVTGLNYNYYRDYDPATGKYVESDPIGLGGGVNTFAYVKGDPIGAIDPSGLDSLTMACMQRPEICAEIFGEMAVNAADIATGGCASRDFNPSEGLKVISATLTAVAVVRTGQGLWSLGRWVGAQRAAARAAAARSAGVVERFSPINRGPLADSIANTFRSGTYEGKVLSEQTTLYRSIGAGGNPNGAFWTRTKPSGPLQSTIDSAIDQNWGNPATTVITRTFPAGTQIFEGAAAAQRGLVGGGNQIYIPGL